MILPPLNEPVEKVLLTDENDVFGDLLTLPSMRSLIVAHSTRSSFLHLAQKSAWGLFLQPQRLKSAEAVSHPLECLG